MWQMGGWLLFDHCSVRVSCTRIIAGRCLLLHSIPGFWVSGIVGLSFQEQGCIDRFGEDGDMTYRRFMHHASQQGSPFDRALVKSAFLYILVHSCTNSWIVEKLISLPGLGQWNRLSHI